MKVVPLVLLQERGRALNKPQEMSYRNIHAQLRFGEKICIVLHRDKDCKQSTAAMVYNEFEFFEELKMYIFENWLTVEYYAIYPFFTWGCKE